MSTNPLQELNRLGQSVWFDYIRRQDLDSGQIKQLIDQDGVSGITSNPSIFEKALAGGTEYDAGDAETGREGRRRPRNFRKP